VIYLLYALHVVLCLFLILVVLLQQGKGADLSVFGGGATMTAFGARSATTMLHRMTVGAFVGFVVTTMAIAYMQGRVQGSSVMKGVENRPAPTQPAPAAPAPTAPAQSAPAESAPAPSTPSAPAPVSPAPPSGN
jgi:preprotein translocase subunit SecG